MEPTREAPQSLAHDLRAFLDDDNDSDPPKVRGTIPVARSGYGNRIGINFAVISGEHPGPRACIMAGVHGDEYDGMESVRWLIDALEPAQLHGSVLAIPCINTAAFTAAARAGQVDHMNLNRTFPGDSGGTLTQQLAATYVAHVIPLIDALVDLHTGGGFGDITPLAVVQRGAEKMVSEIGKAAGNPVLWRGGAWGGTARQAVIEAGKPAVTLEAGGGIFRTEIARRHYSSVINILRHLGCLDGETEYAESYTWYDGTFRRSTTGGFARPHKLAGEPCQRGEKLVSVVDEYGRERECLESPGDGMVLWNRARRSVQPGDEIVIYGETDEPTS